MKASSVFVFLLLINLACPAQFLPFYVSKKSISGLDMLNLKDSVKTLRQYSYSVMSNAGVPIKGEKKKDGMSSCSVDSDLSFQFDAKGRVIRSAFYDCWNEKEVSIKHSYNDAKRLEVIDATGTDGTGFKYVYKYNEKGKLIQRQSTQIFKDHTTHGYKTVYQLNEKGLPAAVINSKTDAADFDTRTLITYDDQGNQSWETFNNKNELFFKDEHNYDEHGNETKHTYYKADGKTIDHIFIFKYDEHNQVIQKEHYEPAETLHQTFSYTYNYDKNKNWISRISFIDGKAILITERTLEYY